MGREDWSFMDQIVTQAKRIAELEAELATERAKSCETCKHWYEGEACDYEIGGERAPEMYTVRRCEIGVRHPGGDLEPSSPDFACNRFAPKET